MPLLYALLLLVCFFVGLGLVGLGVPALQEYLIWSAVENAWRGRKIRHESNRKNWLDSLDTVWPDQSSRRDWADTRTFYVQEQDTGPLIEVAAVLLYVESPTVPRGILVAALNNVRSASRIMVISNGLVADNDVTWMKTCLSHFIVIERVSLDTLEPATDGQATQLRRLFRGWSRNMGGIRGNRKYSCSDVVLEEGLSRFDDAPESVEAEPENKPGPDEEPTIEVATPARPTMWEIILQEEDDHETLPIL